MDSILLPFQVLLLILMILAWLGARRDLINIATTQQTPTLEKIEHLRSAIDELLDELDQKISVIERKVKSLSAPEETAVSKALSVRTVKSKLAAEQPIVDKSDTAESVQSEKYAQVYRLADIGMDPAEIAQQTGFGSSEVEMVLSLRSNTSG